MKPATINGKTLKISDHTDPQKEIFGEAKEHYTVVPKGRRFGATHGAILFIIDKMLSHKSLKILWIDTIHRNIDTYVDRYAMPVLRQLNNGLWTWRMQAKELKVLDSVCDFRSADKPQNIEGFAYDIIVMNEAGIILNNRFLWQTTVRPMCLDYHAKVWFLGTPKGKTCKKDGKEHEFYTLYKRGLDPEFPNWRSLQYTTYDNPRLKEKDIKEVEDEVPGPIRMQEIRGEFIDIGSEEVFHLDWFSIVPQAPSKAATVRVIQSWDTAFKAGTENDYSVCTTWFITKSLYACVDCWRKKVEFPELLVACKEQHDLWKPDIVLIEDAASGQSLIQTIRKETRIPLRPVKAIKDKYTRACAISNLVESGKMVLVEGPWNKELIDEMTEFPGAAHDDILDTVTQLLDFAKSITTGKIQAVSRHIVRTSKALKGY